jgi:hypothetical protein
LPIQLAIELSKGIRPAALSETTVSAYVVQARQHRAGRKRTGRGSQEKVEEYPDKREAGALEAIARAKRRSGYQDL